MWLESIFCKILVLLNLITICESSEFLEKNMYSFIDYSLLFGELVYKCQRSSSCLDCVVHVSCIIFFWSIYKAEKRNKGSIMVDLFLSRILILFLEFKLILEVVYTFKILSSGYVNMSVIKKCLCSEIYFA